MKSALPGLFLAGLLAFGARADRVRLLDDPREAMLARAELIRGAQHEILADSFIVGEDRLTFGLLALLREASERGVDVRLLADASWNHVPGAMQAHLREAGVEIRDYHVLRIDRLHWITQRLHDKMMVVDGRILLVGDRNVEAPYFGDGANVERRDYLDCGPREPAREDHGDRRRHVGGGLVQPGPTIASPQHGGGRHHHR